MQSRVQYYEDGEKNTRFFLNQIKQNDRRTNIRQLKVINAAGKEQLLTRPDEILDQIHDYYSNIFSSKNSEFEEEAKAWIDELKSQNLIPQLSKEKYDYLEQDNIS